MTDDNSNTELVDIPESLGDFKNVFYETEAAEAKEDTDVNAVATDEDTDAPEGDEDAAEEEVSEDDASEESEDEDADEDQDEESDEDDEEEKDKEDKGKRPKSRYQTRISELTRNYRQEQRERAQERAEFIARIEALETHKDAPAQESTVKKSLPQGAPAPDAVDDKGEPLYPLGQFDPQFLLDLTNFGIDVKVKELEENRIQKDAQASLAAEQAEVVNNWKTKVSAYEEVNPDIRDNIDDLVDTFKEVPPQYGEYLATTIMQCENGPAIMEHLSKNIGEAQKIVASGPAAATLAIGRLDDRLAKAAVRPNEEEKRNKKISDSAPPPPKGSRGSAKGSASVRDDTTDLAAFKRKFLST